MLFEYTRAVTTEILDLPNFLGSLIKNQSFMQMQLFTVFVQRKKEKVLDYFGQLKVEKL